MEPQAAARPRPTDRWFPRRVPVWYFVILPPLAMAGALALTRLAALWLPPDLGPFASTVVGILRTAAITAIMASVIAWLAVGYRRDYERRLEQRNTALEETRDFLHRIIDGCGEGIVTLDAADRVTSWNRAAERIFGWTASEMLGRSFGRLLPDDAALHEERQRVGARLRSGEAVRDLETSRLRKDGSRILIRATWTPLYDADDSYAGTTAIVLDVTRESEMRRQLDERNRLAALGEMAAQVAHEVRNPLAGIRGACEMIFEGRAATPMREEIGREVLHQIDRLNRTVTELLEFSRPLAIEARATDLNDLIERIVGVFREDPSCSGVTIERRLHPQLPAVHVDARQIEQVFYNLLLNASQVMESRGTIVISTGVDDGEVAVCVRDSGPGMPPEVAARIFEPFFSTRARGTGLGLTIVRRIVTAHRGRIEVSAPAGGGAEFCLHLPRDGG